MLEYLLLGTAMLLIAVIALLVAVLIRQGRSVRMQDRQNHQISDYVKNFGCEVFDELDAQRNASTAAMQQTGERITGAMSQIGQSQTVLLESMQRQILSSARNQEERFSQMSTAMTETIGLLDARMEQLRQENTRQLTEMRRTMDERLAESLDKRLNESFAQVSTRLEQVYRSLGEMQTLAGGVNDLKKVLTNVKSRGTWGEMQLGALISDVLTKEQYAQNVAVVPGSRERVEFAVKLPGRDADNVYLPIDSKFPMEDFARLQDASAKGDASLVESARKALFVRIREEAKAITKYIAPPHTTDFAIMFLPTEGLYAEVVQQTDLVDRIQREQRVVITGPSNFTALLNALQMGFRTLAIEKRSGEVWKLLGAVKSDFSAFAEALQKTQEKIQQASASIDTAFTKTRTIQRRLGAVESAGTESLQPTFEEDAP